MVITLTVPDETARRIEAVAAARGDTFEHVTIEALDASPVLAEGPGTVEVPVRRRRLALAGVGSSGGSGISSRVDELLADGFGRDD